MLEKMSFISDSGMLVWHFLFYKREVQGMEMPGPWLLKR